MSGEVHNCARCGKEDRSAHDLTWNETHNYWCCLGGCQPAPVMDDLDHARLLELSRRLKDRLESYGRMGETMRDTEDLLPATLEDALELAHHIFRLDRRGLLPFKQGVRLVSQELPHTVWIWEGSWRFLSQYPNAQEALDCVRTLKKDGEKALYVRRGSVTDIRIRADVHLPKP